MPEAAASACPRWVVPGASLTIAGLRRPVPADGPPRARVGSRPARVLFISPVGLRLQIPADAAAGTQSIYLDDDTEAVAVVEVASTLATGVHQVDSPVFDRDGRLYATHSGSRETRAPVPLLRIDRAGVSEPVAVEIANPTSMAIGPSGDLFVSSRFDGHVYRLVPGGTAELYATELGVPTGLAFAPDGTLFVGDRSGSILRVSPGRDVDTFAEIPSSVAAFHLAYGPDRCLYVSAPTLATHDALYRITPDRIIDTVTDRFGRPQGLAFDSTGALHVADALAGSAGLYRVDVSQPSPEPVLVAAAPALIGVAIDPRGGLVLASNDTIWRLDVALKPAIL